MTKLRIMSDVHLEFGPLDLEPAGEDVLVLAGDIGISTQGILWADAMSKKLGVPAVMIAGNHEFYRNREHADHTIASTQAALREIAEDSGGRVTYLERTVAIIAGVRFVGATLWTDFALFKDAERGMFAARSGMNDFRAIMLDAETRFTPRHAREIHAGSVAFLDAACAEQFEKVAVPTVVMTHHAPSAKSVHSVFEKDDCTPAYASHLDHLVEASGAALWVHGHMHHSDDYMIGATRVRTNPRGYSRYQENPAFDPNLIVEVS